MKIPNSMLPHGDQVVLVIGNTVNPQKALLLLHGRGATAEDILSITTHFDVPKDLLVLAPQAARNTWYPERFIEPQEANQPDLHSSLERISSLITFIHTQYKIPHNHIALGGFSQGACLVAEFVKQNPRHYLGVAISSGGLIGSEAEVTQNIEGSLAGTPLYIGCDENDFHIPKQRVTTTANYLREHRADVTLRLYSDLGHTIHNEGFEFLKEALQ